jgi:hypothetical protein
MAGNDNQEDRLKNQRFFNQQICALPKFAGFGGRWGKK